MVMDIYNPPFSIKFFLIFYFNFLVVDFLKTSYLEYKNNKISRFKKLANSQNNQ